MSDLDDFMAAGFADFQAVTGKKPFTIAGVTGTFYGDLDSFAVESEKLRPGGGGLLSDTKAVIVADVAQFAAVANPTQALALLKLTIAGKTWEIGAVEADDVFITFQLQNTSK
jgi:hypothetical protein